MEEEHESSGVTVIERMPNRSDDTDMDDDQRETLADNDDGDSAPVNDMRLVKIGE